MNTCINCKKEFEVLWPDQWVYKRGSGFLCSWKCLREWDKRKEENMATILTDEQKETACRMALNGERPLKYLAGCGAKNATTGWDACRAWAKKHWAEGKYLKLPERFGQEKKAKPAEKKPAMKRPEEQEWFPAEEVYTKDEPKTEQEKLTLKPGGNYQVKVEEEKPNVREIRPEPLKAASLFSRVMDGAIYALWEKDEMTLRWMADGQKNNITLTRNNWVELLAEIMQALEQLHIENNEGQAEVDDR